MVPMGRIFGTSVQPALRKMGFATVFFYRPQKIHWLRLGEMGLISRECARFWGRSPCFLVEMVLGNWDCFSSRKVFDCLLAVSGPDFEPHGLLTSCQWMDIPRTWPSRTPALKASPSGFRPDTRRLPSRILRSNHGTSRSRTIPSTDGTRLGED